MLTGTLAVFLYISGVIPVRNITCFLSTLLLCSLAHVRQCLLWWTVNHCLISDLMFTLSSFPVCAWPIRTICLVWLCWSLKIYLVQYLPSAYYICTTCCPYYICLLQTSCRGNLFLKFFGEYYDYVLGQGLISTMAVGYKHHKLHLWKFAC